MKNTSFVHRTGLLRIAFVLCTLSLSTLLTAQTTVTGLVMDGTNNETAIGASIIVPGTTVGTVTDFDGRFTIEVPDGKVILQISMVGYKTQVVNIKGKTSVEVTLMEDAQLMDEVVVVGYGTMKKRDISGSVSQIKSEDIMSGGQIGVDATDAIAQEQCHMMHLAGLGGFYNDGSTQTGALFNQMVM